MPQPAHLSQPKFYKIPNSSQKSINLDLKYEEESEDEHQSLTRPIQHYSMKNLKEREYPNSVKVSQEFEDKKRKKKLGLGRIGLGAESELAERL